MARDKSAKAKDNPFYSDANVKELEKKDTPNTNNTKVLPNTIF